MASCVESTIIICPYTTNDLYFGIFDISSKALVISIFVILMSIAALLDDTNYVDRLYSCWGVILTILGVLTLFWIFLVEGYKSDQSCVFINESTFPMAFGFNAYAYAGHPYLVELHTSMADTYSRVLLYIYVPVTVLYALTAIIGYTMFGGAVESIYLLSFQKRSLSGALARAFVAMKAMRCFSCSSSSSHGDKSNDIMTTKSTPVHSSPLISIGQDEGKPGSEFTSHDSSDVSTDSSTKTSFTSLTQRPSRNSNNNIREFTFAEQKSVTRNFSRALVIGEGGFGCVYRAMIRNIDGSSKKTDVAVKQLGRRGLQGHKEWIAEVNVLGFVNHPNLVKLVGYCAEDDERGIQRLLVYEYMPNKSVQDHLSSRVQTPLPWTTRLKIAQDAVRGLAYLHEEMEFQIIFRDFKSSNILLDENLNAKLSDFGLARLGPLDGLSHVSTAVVGTVGYAAPEYIQTGRLTYKSDVWSYGVFLYELITGRRPLDLNKPKNEQKLLDWVRPHISSDLRKFQLILDPRLEGNYSLKSAQKLAAVANKCLLKQQRMRPRMSQVLDMLNQIVKADMVSPDKPLQPFKTGMTPSDDPCERSIREGLKRRLVDPIIGENKWFACLASSPTHL